MYSNKWFIILNIINGFLLVLIITILVLTLQDISIKEWFQDEKNTEKNLEEIDKEIITEKTIEEYQVSNNFNSKKDGFLLVFNQDCQTCETIVKELSVKAKEKNLELAVLNLQNHDDVGKISSYIGENKKNIELYKEYQEFYNRLNNFTHKEYQELLDKIENTDENNIEDKVKYTELVEKYNDLRNSLYEKVFSVLNENVNYISNYREELQEKVGDLSLKEVINRADVKEKVLKDLETIESDVPLTKEEMYHYITILLQKPTRPIFTDIPQQTTIYFIHNGSAIEEHSEKDYEIILNHPLLKEISKFNTDTDENKEKESETTPEE